MRSLRLILSGPALLRLETVGKRPTNPKYSTREERRVTEGRGAMAPSFNRSNCAKATFALMLALLAWAAAPTALGQEATWGDSSTPLVYNVENTGWFYPAPNFPSFAHLPIIRPLPDPFEFNDGFRRPWFTNWEQRRNEIKAGVEKYEIGAVPDCHDCTIAANYVPPAAGSSNGTLTVNVTRNGKTLTLTSGVYIPQGMGNGPFPALIPMEISFCFGTFCFPPPTPPDYGSLPASVFSGLPIATVGYVSTQVAAYNFSSPSDHTADPFYQLYPEYCEGICSGGSNQGEYAAWSWGVSRLIDGMEIATRQSVNPLPIDMKHLAVTGCSFAGKMALYAGAFDERIALTIAQESGGGGAPSWRVSHEIESQFSVEDVDDTNYDWFAGQMQQFAGPNVYKLPVDQHELMAMIAPRALLETGNTNNYWLSNGSNYVTARATQRIYNELGIGDRFGFYIDGGHPHCGTLPAESPVIASFVNKFMLGQLATTTDVEVYPNGPGQPTSPPSGDYQTTITYPDYPYYFPTMDYKRWTDWWGTNRPVLPGNWNTGGTLVLSLNGGAGFASSFDSLRINSGDTVEAGYGLMLGGNHPAATVSFQEGNVETDVVCSGGSSYTFTVPLKSIQSYSIAAGNYSWLPSASRTSALAYEGSVTATPPTGVSECVGGHTTGAYFTAVGIQDGSAGDAAGPGILSTDWTDPLNARFHLADTNTGTGGQWSPPVTVNPLPVNCPAAPFATQTSPPFSVAGPPQNCPVPPYAY